MKQHYLAMIVISCVAALAAVPPAQACNTPVFRYAMYNWQPARYPVFWLHDGPAKEGDPVAKVLREASEGSGEVANVEYVDVNAADDKQMARLPEQVKKAWQARDKQLKALHLVFSPWGSQLFSGRLEPKQVTAMLHSPTRKRIGELLKEGNAAVFLVLAAPADKKTRDVERAIDKIAEQARSGEIEVRTEDPNAAAPANSKEDDAAKPSRGPRIVRLTVTRKDAAEDWLLKPLLSMEEDSKEFADEAMVFPVYGRGRALPPFIGKGINEENLSECVGFLGGACSCMIKDQNPGADLLITWDWDATAQCLAADDEDTDGGQTGYREVGMPAAEKSSAEPPAAGKAVPAKSEPGKAAAKPAVSPPSATPPAVKSEPAKQTLTPAVAQPSTFVRTQMRTYAAAVAVGACLVVVSGYFWMRRKSHSV